MGVVSSSLAVAPRSRRQDGRSGGGGSGVLVARGAAHAPPLGANGFGAPTSQGALARNAHDAQHQVLDARQQQERDDAEFARRLAMEEMAAFEASGGGSGAASSSMAPQVTTARAVCPACGTQNEFTAAGRSGPVIPIRCGHCSGEFQVLMPPGAGAAGAAGAGANGASSSLMMCRRCGTMNQFPTPPPGQPAPDVLCGCCGRVSPAPQRVRGGRRPGELRLLEALLADPQRAAGHVPGPMVRINVNGQRRVVPLALLLALMAEEADKSNPAQVSDIAALPTRKLKGTDHLGQQSKCLVCLEEFADGDDVKTLPCLHIYHQQCVERWLRTDNSCPVCKTPIGPNAMMGTA